MCLSLYILCNNIDYLNTGNEDFSFAFFFILSVSTLCFDFSTFSLFSISFFPTALPSTLADSLASDGQESESGAALFMLMVLFMCIFFIKYLQLFF